MKLILSLTNQVVSNLNFQELLRTISASVREVMHDDAVAIMSPEPDGAHLRAHAWTLQIEQRNLQRTDIAIPVEARPLGETFSRGHRGIADRLDPEQHPETYAKAAREGMNSLWRLAPHQSGAARLVGLR